MTSAAKVEETLKILQNIGQEHEEADYGSDSADDDEIEVRKLRLKNHKRIRVDNVECNSIISKPWLIITFEP